MKKFILFLLSVILLSYCIKDIISDHQNSVNYLNKCGMNNCNGTECDTTIIQLNDFRDSDFICYFNIKNKPVKFEVYNSTTLIFDSGYIGSKIYQSQLDSAETINDNTYQPYPMNSYYWETIFIYVEYKLKS